MRLLRASLVISAAIAPGFALSARADDADKTKVENQRFSTYKTNDAGDEITELHFIGDVTYAVSKDIPDEVKKKIRALAYTLYSNDEVKVYLKNGVVVGLEKGRVTNPFDQLPAVIQKAIKEAEEDDDIIITTVDPNREQPGKFKSYDQDGIWYIPIIPGKKKPEPNVGKSKILFKNVKRFQNKTKEEKAKIKPGSDDPTLSNDPVQRLDLRVGDTVRIGFGYGQITAINPTTLTVNTWAGNAWGGNKDYPRATLTDVSIKPLELRRSTPVNGNGEVVVKEEKERVGSKNQLTLRGSVWHDQNEFILVGAQLVFTTGKLGSNLAQEATWHDEFPIPPVFGNERWSLEKKRDDEDGQVTIYFDPAKHLIPARSPEAKGPIVMALAAVDRDPAAMPRVYAAAALNGDPDLALLLVVRHSNIPTGADQERQQQLIVDALVQFGDKGAKAIIEHVATPDGTFAIPIARDDGLVQRKEAKDQASAWKKYELQILCKIPGGAAGDRGKRLFDLYEERGPEFGTEILKVFQARTAESIDALLNVAVSAGSRPTPDEAKRADDAGTLVKGLGEPGLAELLQRIRALGPQGLVTAKQLQVKKDRGLALAEVIQEAIFVLVEAERAQRKQRLTHVLEEAKAKSGQRDWEGALATVERILQEDRDIDDARKLLYECLVKVAQTRREQKRRFEASKLIRRVIDDGQRGRGAESMYANILLEAVKEDLEGTCIRREPDECADVMKKAGRGEIFKLANVKTTADASWFPVKASDREIGWVHADAVDPKVDSGDCTIHGDFMAPGNIRRTLDQIRKYGAELGPQADQIDGELWVRDAEQKYNDGSYSGAYASYQKARELIPTDPRLSAATKCWVMANGFLLLIFLGVISVALLGLVMVVRNRQKRVRVAEFKYYGKDRLRVEREIDGASAPGAQGDGAPAPSEQPPAAPTA